MMLSPDGVPEHPLLVTLPLVRPIMDDEKTNTMRVLVKQPPPGPLRPWEPVAREEGGACKWSAPYQHLCDPFGTLRREYVTCPFGKPGHRLWVRETFGVLGNRSIKSARPSDIVYRADVTGDAGGQKWCPNLHLPRWACRTVVEVTNIRMKRVQQITPDELDAEGVAPSPPARPNASGSPSETDRAGTMLAFRETWDRLNGARGYSWVENPWVFSISFRRLRGP